jgi:putative Holliday junction resolvase
LVNGRVLAIDVGGRRVGLAISDRTRTLARPLETIVVTSETDAVDRVARRIDELAAEEDGVTTIVVGLPARLDGSASNATPVVIKFIDALKRRTHVPIVTEDERLTSREAESRLAANERDWRRRKAKLDAAAAAIFLQDYLDRGRYGRSAVGKVG